MLAPGTRIGPHEVAARIGVGGMGEVYSATDTTLGRRVAIKVLPEAFAQDGDRLARFEREARTLAALNHPHIAQVHGFEKSGGIHALVMELVEGPTLAERLDASAGPGSGQPVEGGSGTPRHDSAPGPLSARRRGLPMDEALAIAKQVAEALEAAHEQGIVHRDLKPANIKVRPDGTVKVLDFGLAKALEPVGSAALSPGLSQSPTITTPAMTQAGMILGTAAYMSPEQAKGRPADKRSDIWAFGCVLYEMLTGRRAFAAEDVSETLAAVLMKPPDLSALPEGVPAGVRLVVQRSLQKDPKQRLRDIGDVRLALEGAFDSGAPTGTLPASPTPVWRRALPVASALLLGALLASGVAWVLRPDVEPGELVRFEHEIATGLQWGNTGRSVMALSPDGRHLVYNTAQGLVIRTMGDLEARLVPGPSEAGLSGPFFSPDSQSVAYFTGEGLKRVAISGGRPILVASGMSLQTTVFGGSWGTDGFILAGVSEGIVRVPAEGGTPELIVRAAGGETVYGPQMLPDGDSVLFSVARGPWNQGLAGEIVVHSLRTGTRTVLVRGGSDARYVESGHLVYSVGNGLVAVGFDAQRLAVRGGPVSVVDGVARSLRDLTGAANFGISRQGTLAYLPDFGMADRRMRWFDRSGAAGEAVGAPAPAIANLALSPVGDRVVFDRAGTQTGLWLTDLRRGVTSLLASTGTDGSWAPGGERVAFSASFGSVVAVVPVAGGEPQVLSQRSDGQTWVEGWHPGGESLAVVWWVPGGVDRGAVLTLSDTQDPVVFDEAADLDEIAFSPDGKWIAYNARRDIRGGWEVYVVPYPPTGERIQVSAAGGVQPKWRGDGRELYYLTPDGTLMVVPVSTAGGFTPGPPARLFHTGLDVDPIRDQYVPSRDGMRFLISLVTEQQGAAARPRFVIVQNWLQELKRLVPAN